MDEVDKISNVRIEKEKVPLLSKAMLEKGLRYVPMTIYTVYGECTSPRWFHRTSDERMRMAYSQLAEKVKIHVRKHSRLKGAPRSSSGVANSSTELKEVRDKKILYRDLLSNSSLDYRILIRRTIGSQENPMRGSLRDQ